MSRDLPPPAVPLVRFAQVLRQHHYPVATEQTISFLTAVRLLGPSSILAIRQAAYACFAPSAERRGEFEALFRAHFYGDIEVAIPTQLSPPDEIPLKDPARLRSDELIEIGAGESGQAACSQEQLSLRHFATQDPFDALRRLETLAGRLPIRRGFRLIRAARGRTIHIVRSLARMVRNDGDLPRPVFRKRARQPRNVLLLIDVSGSMKRYTAVHLRLAHALCHTLQKVEVFTLGTRLTRISDQLRSADENVALSEVAELVADWDGGTRLGPTLQAFLSIPRFVNFARGAVVLVISDALECGDPEELERAVCRLQRLAWRLSVASPLVSDPGFRPETRALRTILPHLDDLIDGSRIGSIIDFLLGSSKPAPSAAIVWAKRARNA
jgi:uncharacterized protein